MARKVVATIVLRHPVQLVEGNSSPEFMLTELKVYDPELGDMLDAATEQKTVGASLPTWARLTGRTEAELKKLKPYDAGQLAAQVGALLAPFAEGAAATAARLLEEAARHASPASPPNSSAS